VLILYRLYQTACSHANPFYKSCHCPMWVEGIIDELLSATIAEDQLLGARRTDPPRTGAGKTQRDSAN
jgi:hypothetical protein